MIAEWRPRYSALVVKATASTPATRGLAAAAIFEVDGKRLAVAGALDNDEVRAIGMMIARPLQDPDPLERMLDGAMLLSPLDDRVVLVGIASRCVFVAAVLHEDTRSQRALAHELLDNVEREISRARAAVRAPPISSPGGGGSSSGPAELPVIELGITVRRPS
jgi:hypothetical protein